MTLTDLAYAYTQDQRIQDESQDGYRFEIAQISDFFGEGPAASLTVS